VVKVKSANEPSGSSGGSLSRFNFCSMKCLGVVLLPPGWDASPLRRVTPGWRETLWGKPHDSMSQAKARTGAARSGDKRIKQEATVPPQVPYRASAKPVVSYPHTTGKLVRRAMLDTTERLKRIYVRDVFFNFVILLFIFYNAFLPCLIRIFYCKFKRMFWILLLKTIIRGMIRKNLRKSRFTFTYYHNNWMLVYAQGAHNLVE